jgi:hypothetical protein
MCSPRRPNCSDVCRLSYCPDDSIYQFAMQSADRQTPLLRALCAIDPGVANFVQ